MGKAIVNAQISMMPQLIKIEKSSFADPWTEGMLASELTANGAIFRAFVFEEKVLGFCIAHIVHDECEIYNIVSDKNFRQQGIGKALIDDMIDCVKKQGVATIYLEVRSKNEVAISLYRKVGFECCGLRRGYYSSPKDDAVLMKLRLESV